MLRMFFGCFFFLESLTFPIPGAHQQQTSLTAIVAPAYSHSNVGLRRHGHWSQGHNGDACATAKGLLSKCCHSQRPPVQMLTTVGQFMVTNPSIRLIKTWWFLSDDDGISRIYQVSKGIGAREVCMTNLGILQDKNWALLPQDLQDRNPAAIGFQGNMVSIWFNKDHEDPSAKSRSYSCSLMSPAMRAMAFTRLGGTGTPFASPHPHLRSRGNHKRDCWRRIEGWSIPEWSLCPLCQLCHPPEKWWKISKFFVEPSFLVTIILRTSMSSQINGSIFHFRLNTKNHAPFCQVIYS